MSKEHLRATEIFATELENFRARWKPTGIDAPYHERDFNTQLSYIVARAMDLGSRPATEALQNLARMAPSPFTVVTGVKP